MGHQIGLPRHHPRPSLEIYPCILYHVCKSVATDGICLTLVSFRQMQSCSAYLERRRVFVHTFAVRLDHI